MELYASNATNWWASFVDKYSDEDEILLPVFGGWLVGFVTYCVYGGTLTIFADIMKTEWLQKRKFQKNRPYKLEQTSYNPSFAQLVTNVMINWLIVIPAGLYFLQKVLKPIGLGVYVSREMPSWQEVLFHIVISPFVVDFTFFVGHYWLHTKPLYARVHKVHHDFKAPHALACIYAHPFEALVGNTFAVMGPAFFLRLHVLEWFIGVFLGWVGTCNGHSGYSLPWSKSRSNGFQDFHDYHHEFFVGNYGSTGFMDYLCGTDQKWKERCEKIKAEEKVKKLE